MSKIRTHYDNLKIARNAPDVVIRASYEALIQTYHPDKFEGAKQQEAERITKIIRESYEVLSDPIRRSVHDRWIEEQDAQTQQSQFEDIKTDEPKPSNVPKVPPESKASNLWLVCLIIACLAIIIYGSLYPSPETRTSSIAGLVGYNLPIGVVFWLMFFIICGLKKGVRKATIAFAAIYGSLVGISLFGYSQYHYLQTKTDVITQQKVVASPIAEDTEVEQLHHIRGLHDKYLDFDANDTEKVLSELFSYCQYYSEKGSATGKLCLADLYKNGKGVTKNLDLSLQLTQNAANLGLPIAQFELGREYENGGMVPINKKSAEQWYLKAAHQNYVEAERALGGIYWNRGDMKSAVIWYQKAANQGNLDAMQSLGFIYSTENSGIQDDSLAIYWFRKVISQGGSSSIAPLDLIYERNGMPIQDPAKLKSYKTLLKFESERQRRAQIVE
jgi:hypothetical protein